MVVFVIFIVGQLRERQLLNILFSQAAQESLWVLMVLEIVCPIDPCFDPRYRNCLVSVTA